jgi:hypothetical protein
MMAGLRQRHDSVRPMDAPELQGKASRLDFVGDLAAAIALIAVPAPSAHAMLPKGLRLAPQSLTSGDQHPLLLVLGRQRNVRLALFSTGTDYLEFILAVPFVEHARQGRHPRGPFGYLPRLFLDRRMPILAGRLLFAYDKAVRRSRRPTRATGSPPRTPESRWCRRGSGPSRDRADFPSRSPTSCSCR